jgi:DNA-binding Lrp family transcriptional regulator
LALIALKRAQQRSREVTPDLDAAERVMTNIQTPYDDIIPQVDDPSVQFYLDSMKIYLGITSGTVTLEDAMIASMKLKQNPEFAKSPVDPTLVPINETYKKRIVENLTTLSKFNLFTLDSIKSAFTFAFLTQDTPIVKTDYEVLAFLTKNPSISLVKASDALGLAPRTIARSIDRIKERHMLRFSTLYDTTAFGIQSAILFFTLQDGVDWPEIETGFATFPYTKNMLKTSMTDLGYVSFMVPDLSRNWAVFKRSVKSLTEEVFDYTKLHFQMAFGWAANLSLLNDGVWSFAENTQSVFDGITEESEESKLNILRCGGEKKGLEFNDLVVAAELQLDFRAQPSKISQSLRLRGWDIDSRMITSSIRKLKSRGVLIPYVHIGGIGLASNFCFEILCNQKWKERILSLLPLLPLTMLYESQRGLILWIQIPSNHQVDYYQMFRSLEEQVGVESVKPIMTITQKGARSTLDLVRLWEQKRGRFHVDPASLDLTEYLL